MIMHMLMSNIININCRYREMCIPCPDKRMKYTGSCECPTGYFKSYDRCIENGQKVINSLTFDNSYLI